MTTERKATVEVESGGGRTDRQERQELTLTARYPVNLSN